MDDPRAGERLIVYGHVYCPQASLLADTLHEYRIPHEWRDVIDGDPRYKDELRALARGHLSVPTVIFPDGSVMVEPWPGEVLKRLNRSRPGFLRQLFGR